MCMLTVSFKAIMIESQALESLILQTRDKENKIFLTKLWGVTFGITRVYIEGQTQRVHRGYKIQYWPLCIIFIYQEHKLACREI